MKTSLLLSFIVSIFFLNGIYSQNLIQDSKPEIENLNQSYAFQFLSNITNEKATQIKEFTLKRQGVVLCEINVMEKTIKIGIDNTLDLKSVNYLMDIIRKNFLDAVDAPKEKDPHNHKH